MNDINETDTSNELLRIILQSKQTIIELCSKVEHLENKNGTDFLTDPNALGKKVEEIEFPTFLDDHRKEMDDLKFEYEDKLKNSIKERDELKSEQYEYTVKLEDYKSSYESKLKDCEELKFEIERIQKDKELLESKNISYENERRDFEKKYIMLKDKVEEIVTYVNTFDQTVLNLTNRQELIVKDCKILNKAIENSVKLNERYITERNSLKEDIVGFKSSILEKDYRIKELEDELQLSNDNEKKIKEHVTSILSSQQKNENSENMMNFLSKSTEQNNRQEKQILQLTSYNKKLKNEHFQKINKLLVENNTLHENNLKNLHDNEKVIFDMKNNLQTVETNYNNLENVNKNLLTEKDSIMKKYENLLNVNNKTTKSYEELKMKILSLENESKNLQRLIEQNEKNLKEINLINDKLIKENEKLQNEKTNKNDKIIKLEFLLNEEQNKVPVQSKGSNIGFERSSGRVKKNNTYDRKPNNIQPKRTSFVPQVKKREMFKPKYSGKKSTESLFKRSFPKFQIDLKKKKKQKRVCGICDQSLYGLMVTCLKCQNKFHAHCCGDDVLENYVCKKCTKGSSKSGEGGITSRRKKRKAKTALKENPKKKKRKLVKKLRFNLK